MENEIKVNDYVRMIDGLIAKIVTKDKDDHFILDRYYAGGRYLTEFEVKNDIVKHSSNLIDLIQCGDYVNGEQVCESRYDELYVSYVYCGGIGVRTTEAYTTFIKDMKEEDIETVVTKEMMESISYKVKE